MVAEAVRIVIDTGVFWRPEALEKLAGLRRRIVLPAVAFAERSRQLVKRGVSVDRFLQVLARMHIQVEDFTVRQARRYAVNVAAEALWLRASRDAMIAGHLEPGDVLWTTNSSDFLSLGVPPDQVHAV